MGMAIVESAMLGVISTILGLIGGYILLQWVVIVLIPNTMPDLGIEALIKPTTLIMAVILGVASGRGSASAHNPQTPQNERPLNPQSNGINRDLRVHSTTVAPPKPITDN